MIIPVTMILFSGGNKTTCLSFNETNSKWDNQTEISCDPLCHPIETFETEKSVVQDEQNKISVHSNAAIYLILLDIGKVST